MPTSASTVEKLRMFDLLKWLDPLLRRVNPYIQDYMTAAQIYASESPTTATFVIDADRAPTNAVTRQYGNFQSELWTAAP